MRRLLLLLILVLVAGGLLYGVLGQSTAASTAIVSIVRTALEAQRAGAAFAAVADGEAVVAGDQVRADGNGRGFVTFHDGSTLSVDPGARVTVAQLSNNLDGSTIIRLEQALGRTWSSVQKFANPNSRFEVKTPAGTATVRGTAFETIVAADGTTVVRTHDGTVVVSAQGVDQVSTANTQVTITPGQAPSAPQPIPAGPSLRFTSPAGTALTAFTPNDAACGAGRADAPGCLEGSVILREVVPGVYGVVLSAAATANATLTMEGLFGATTVSTQALTRPMARGDVVRTTVRVALDGQGRPSLATPTPFEALTAVCGAEARGRVFATGSLEERSAALLAYAGTNRGQPASLVLTDAELTAALQAAAQIEGLPITVRNVRARTTLGGTELAGDAALGPLTATARVVAVAGADGGRLALRLKSLDLAPVPAPLLDQVRLRVQDALEDAGGDLPLAVERVAFRAGCVAIVGSAR